MSDFARLWAGFTISRVGSQVTVLALPLAGVLLLGAGATETGLMLAARTAPSIVAALFIGVWVDRYARRPILVGTSIASAVVVGSVPVAWALGSLTLLQLYVVSFLAGLLWIATDLARGALLPTLVGRARLVGANSRLQASDAVASVAGPSLGGSLVQAIGAPLAMAVDAASFVVSAAFLASMRARETLRPREAGRHMRHEIADGLRWMRDHQILFRSTVAIALANIEWFAVQAVLVVYATRDLALSPAVLGIALAAIGPFSLVGAALAGPVIGRIGLGPVMILALLLEAVSRLILPFAAGSEAQAAAVLALTQALVGLTVPLWTVSSRTLQQAATPDHLLARVQSATYLVGFGVAPPAALGAGLLGDAIGLRPTLLIAGLIAVVAVLYLFFSSVRTFHSVPDTAASLRTDEVTPRSVDEQRAID